MGLVVVASDIGGVSESIPEVMREFLFASGDYGQLADNIERLLLPGEAALQKLGVQGRDFVLRNYDVRELNRHILASLLETSAQPRRDVSAPKAAM